MGIRFQLVRDILTSEITRAATTNGQLAEGTGLSVGAISNYRQGSRAPDADTARKIARFFYPRDRASRLSLEERLREASKEETSISGNTLLDVTAGKRPTAVTTLDYRPFSGTPDCFFETIFERFLGLAGILPADPPRLRTMLTAEMLTDSDLLLSIFDSLDRRAHLGLAFWHMPIRISLGAVIHQKFENRRHIVAAALSDPAKRTSALIRPIVIAGDVGSVHCKRKLRFSDTELIELQTRDPDALQRCLEQETEAGGHAIPVICVDDFMAYRLLHGMNGSGRSVFRANTRREIQGEDELIPGVYEQASSARRELPQFYLSAATKASDRDFTAFISEGLVHFLSTEVETTAVAFKQLAVELADTILRVNIATRPGDMSSQLWAEAWEWVWYALILDSKSIDSYYDAHLPWKPILRRARQLLQQDFSAQEQLEVQVARFYSDSRITAESLNRLCELFDVELGPEYRSPDRYTGRSGQLVSVLRSALRGEDHKILPRIIPFDWARPEHRIQKTALLSVLGKLDQMYNEMALAGGAALQRIATDIQNVDVDFSGDRGTFLLASVAEDDDAKSKNSLDYVGGICLCRDHTATETQGSRWQIRNLWVDKEYRHHGIGGRLLDRAIAVVREKGATSAYVELLPDLMWPAHLVVSRGFRFEPEKTAARQGWLVFEQVL
jgi:transcriptional regulator with XRE-family HTH domain